MLLVKFSSKYTILICSLIVLFFAYFYSDLINITSTQLESSSVVKQSIIKSWKHLVTLPERSLGRSLKIAIGYR